MAAGGQSLFADDRPVMSRPRWQDDADLAAYLRCWADRRSYRLKEDTKEVLGIGKDDFWYYPGLVAGIASFWAARPMVVATLLLLSTGFLVVFLAKSTPRYLASPAVAHEGDRRGP